MLCRCSRILRLFSSGTEIKVTITQSMPYLFIHLLLPISISPSLSLALYFSQHRLINKTLLITRPDAVAGALYQCATYYVRANRVFSYQLTHDTNKTYWHICLAMQVGRGKQTLYP